MEMYPHIYELNAVVYFIYPYLGSSIINIQNNFISIKILKSKKIYTKFYRKRRTNENC